jgi:hypothetical protein
MTFQEQFPAIFNVEMFQHMLGENPIERGWRDRYTATEITQIVDAPIGVSVDIEPLLVIDSPRTAAEVEVPCTPSFDEGIDYPVPLEQKIQEPDLDKMQVPPNECQRPMREDCKKDIPHMNESCSSLARDSFSRHPLKGSV